MRVTVFGATGGIGRHVVGQLLESGHHVAAVARDLARLPATNPALTLHAITDLTDPAAIIPALRGSDAVISAIGPRRLKDCPVATPATRGIAAAMAETGVERLIAVSAAPVGPTPPGESILLRYVLTPVMSMLLHRLYIDLAEMERIMAHSGLAWTSVRPPRLSNGPLTGRYRTTVGGNVPHGYAISRADVAHAMCAAIGDAAMVNQSIGVAD